MTGYKYSSDESKVESTVIAGSYGLKVVNPDGSNVGSPTPLPVYERIEIAAGAAGTTGTYQLIGKPVYNSTGAGLNTSADTSFAITLGGALTTQVATAAAVLANGDYHIDPYTGLITFQKANADTTHEVNYLAGSENVNVVNANDLETVLIVRNAYGVTPVTTGAYVQLVAALAQDIKELEVFDSSGQTLAIATGAAASEVDRFYISPGGNGRIIENIPAGVRVSIIAISANATVGELVVNFRS